MSYTYTTNLISVLSGEIVDSPTIVEGDVQVSTDGGDFENIETLPTVTPAGSGVVLVSLSDSEIGASNCVVRFLDQSGGEWERQFRHLPLSETLIPEIYERTMQTSNRTQSV